MNLRDYLAQQQKLVDAELDRLRTTSRKPEAPRDQILEIEHEGPPTAPIDGGGGR